MSAIVKHISVHPDFKYARRTGIFDDLDRKAAEEKAAAKKNRQSNKLNAFAFNYSPFIPKDSK